MKKTAQFISIVIFLIFSFGGAALGVEKITIPNNDIKVYAGPSLASPVVTILKKGTVVTAGVNPGGGFKKVLITDVSGKKVIGYIAQADLKPPIFAVTPGPADKKQKKTKVKSNGLGLRGHYSIGLEVGVNYQNQSASSVSDSGGDYATLSGFSGADFMFGVIFNLPVRPTFTLESDLIYKPITLTGNGSVPGAGQPTSISNHKSYIEISETVKFYADTNSDWWYGPGLEVDYGFSGNLQLGTSSYTYNSSDLKTLFGIYGATGYDFMSKKNFYITPSFRLGFLLNGSPLVIEADVLIAGSYRF